MKLSSEVLLEIVAIFQSAVLEGKDASQQLRDLDLAEKSDGTLGFSYNYLIEHPRATTWEA